MRLFRWLLGHPAKGLPDTPLGRSVSMLKRTGVDNIGMQMMGGRNGRGEDARIDIAWQAENVVAAIQVSSMLEVMVEYQNTDPEFQRRVRERMREHAGRELATMKSDLHA